MMSMIANPLIVLLPVLVLLLVLMLLVLLLSPSDNRSSVDRSTD